ncbi:Dual specificity protein kinase lkh1, partial [Tolypocladium capitatum]
RAQRRTNGPGGPPSSSNTTTAIADVRRAAPTTSVPPAPRILPRPPVDLHPANAGYPTDGVKQTQTLQPEPTAHIHDCPPDQHLNLSYYSPVARLGDMYRFRMANAIFTASGPVPCLPPSSNGHEEAQDTAPKRKRTRQQANEVRHRDIRDLGDGILTYKPPPYPPKKSGDVRVRVVQDRHHHNDLKVDDHYGHYIVIPDASLTDRYHINKLLGQGTFRKVVQARDQRYNELVAAV